MKILGLIFLALGLLGTLKWGITGILLMSMPLSQKVAEINFLFSFFAFLFALLGFHFYMVSTKKEKTEEIIKNLSARQKSERETFSLKITFEKVFLQFGSGTVGVKINDEDKGFIKMGQESTYNLSEGDHKIQFYSTLLKRRTFYPAKVINFTKDTCMVVSFKYNRAFGKIEITD